MSIFKCQFSNINFHMLIIFQLLYRQPLRLYEDAQLPGFYNDGQPLRFYEDVQPPMFYEDGQPPDSTRMFRPADSKEAITNHNLGVVNDVVHDAAHP